jgi:hypothetical protein
MTRWEYAHLEWVSWGGGSSLEFSHRKSIDISKATIAFIGMFRSLGDDGWEMVSTHSYKGLQDLIHDFNVV